MKAFSAALALALLCPAGLRAETSVLPEAKDGPMLGQQLGGTVDDAVQPAFRVVEGVSDGVYDFMRRRIIGAIFPDRFNRNLKAAPNVDSAPLFDKNLHEKESRFLDRAREAYPVFADGASLDQGRILAWRSWAAAEQTSVAVDALKDTLVHRYQLEIFGQSAGAYAKDKRNWDPGFLTMAGLVGGSFMYLNGLHASARVADVKVAVDLPSGLRLQKAVEGGEDARRLARLELGYKDKPVTLSSEWGLSGGRVRGERVGVNYRLRY